MLNRLSLKLKILMIVIPLGLAVIATSTYIILNFSHHAKQMEGMAMVADSFEDFGKLIVQLQTERGKSLQFLTKKLDLVELNAQRKENTDLQLNKGRKMLTLLPFPPGAHKDLENTFNAIGTLRQKIDNNETTASNVITEYSNVIRGLMTAEGQAARLFSGKGIELKLINITVVESLKEALALTRGTYASIFAANTPLSRPELSKIESTRSSIQVILGSSSLELMHNLHDKAHALMTSNEWKSLYQDMDRLKEKATKGGYGVEPTIFFNKFTTLIENFNKILTEERTAIIKLAEDEATKSYKTFYIILYALIIAIGGLIGFAWLILKDLIKKEAIELIATERNY